MKSKLLKVAWIRDPKVPAGISAKGQLNCPCGNGPWINYESGPDVWCSCGRRYSWDGCIKGVSVGSKTLTAYRVIFEDGSDYATSMAADVNLQNAYRYFIDRVIDGKLVVDVEPCVGG